jgi:hyperosmotically inducible periplasmic protein
MRKIILLSSAVLFAVGGYANPGYTEEAFHNSPLAQTAPDNTGRNVRDREGKTLTPGDQSESKADLDLTQRIRQAVVADESLSTTAHNVKIITVNGVVTLRGPVNSDQEKAKIAAVAEKIAGVKQVDNQLEIAGH